MFLSDISNKAHGAISENFTNYPSEMFPCFLVFLVFFWHVYV